ncbi:tRNA(Met) cytidine acetyltransferase TmcA [compost metagenome]
MRQLPTLLAGELKELDTDLVWQCLRGESVFKASALDEYERQELRCFAHHHKPFELCQYSLQRWLAARVTSLDELTPDERRLLIATIWQYAPWSELAKVLRLAGKPALIKALPDLLARLLDKEAWEG